MFAVQSDWNVNFPLPKASGIASRGWRGKLLSLSAANEKYRASKLRAFATEHTEKVSH